MRDMERNSAYTGMVICPQRAANDLHAVQLMPVPPPSSPVSSKSRTVYLSGAGLPRLSWKRGRETDVVGVDASLPSVPADSTAG